MRTPVKPTPGKVVVVPAIPACNFCQDGTPGPYDFKTRMGPWANGCERHWEEHRSSPELGVGLGQLWVTAEQVPADELAAAETAVIDIRVQPEGTISVLYGESAEGRDWLAENLAGDAVRWGPHGYVVEHRYVDPILEGAAEDGLAVGVEPDSDVPIVASARLPRRES